MADMISSTDSMDMAIKSNGVVDMSPASLSNSNCKSALLNLKDLRTTHSDMSESAANLSVADVNSSSSSSNRSANSPPATTFRCERCDNFETSSRAALLLHVVQCLSNHACLRTGEDELDKFKLNAHAANELCSTAARKTPIAEVQSSNGTQHGTAGDTNNQHPSSSSTSSNTNTSSRKVFECDVCNMKFSNGANMRRHKMRHTGVKPYECRVCQKRFFRKDHLAEHFTTHTKTLPYHCPICNRGFQRQIAMRAHFQNEHVGQHDLVKTCPLCSYRAGSMKSLRIHFFNRHGIDLDNPGANGTSSLLLALESQVSQVAAAAAAASFVPNLANVAAAAAAAAAANHNNNNNNHHNNNNNHSNMHHQSDSSESMRSTENATPPMHFLTPHVEISTLADNASDNNLNIYLLKDNPNDGGSNGNHESNHESNMLLDCNIKTQLTIASTSATSATTTTSTTTATGTTPSSLSLSLSLSSNSSMNLQNENTTKNHLHDNHIAPSISLIPIKQEIIRDEPASDLSKNSISNEHNGDETSETDFSTPNSTLTSLIKVSPLKSLLREDLKRRICAKANNRMTRNAAASENNNNNTNNHNNSMHGASTSNGNSSCSSTPICNGTITSTGMETDSMMMLNRKQLLSCLFCGIDFPDETLYFLHKGCHCESNPWKCNICGEQLNNVYEFNSHLLSKSHQ